MSVMGAAWVRRLAKFRVERKFASLAVMLNRMNSTTKPRTAGIAPSSPPRTRRK